MLTEVCSIRAEINLSRLSHNLSVIKNTVGEKVEIMAVVKANAYGHGLVPIAKHLIGHGVSHFGVARLEEAIILRQALSQSHILILSPIDPKFFTIAVKNDITLTPTETSDLKNLAIEAKKQKKKAKIHLKIDTGLNRAGIEPEQVSVFLKKASLYPSLEIEGIFTHLANPDDEPFSQQQLAIFKKVVTQLKQAHQLPKLIHAAATGAIFKYKESHFNLVRPGLGLYGHFPGKESFNLRPLLSLHTRITRIHLVKAGETVGYNRTFKAKKNLLAATLAAGYADGLRRAPISWPFVQINGQLAPIIGRMSMDQAVINITKINPTPTLKTEVTLISDNMTSPVSLEKIAEIIDTSPYEVLTSLSPDRISRVSK